MSLAAVRPLHIASVIRTVRMAQRAPRTVRNVNAILKALFREASVAGHVEQTPCILGRAQLGKIRDARPEWRREAIYTKAELETLISDPRIPQDRRTLYALLGLAAL